MALKAKALYDFQGDASLKELSFSTGDEIVVIRQTYVELHNETGADSDDWDEDGEEDWDDADKSQPTGGAAAAAGRGDAPPSYGGGTFTGGNTIGRANLKRSVYRFSGFVKAGAESYMIGGLKEITIDASVMIHMQIGPDGLSWVPNPEPFVNVQVSHAGKRSKFKGMKSFEAYTITEGAGHGGAVERRHKHFVWLFERLRDKYSCICVPPLPDKQFMSKYGEDEVNKRQMKLQIWLARVCRHPVLSRDKLSLHHFLKFSSSDEKGWKIGKRKAEKDDFVGGQFFKLISQDAPCPKNSDKEIEQFALVVKDISTVVRKNQEIALQHADRMFTGFKREYKRISEGFNEMGEEFGKAASTNGDSVKLSRALVRCGMTYEEIANMWSAQPPNDQIPLHDALKEYVGLLNQFSDAISSCRAATEKITEMDQMIDSAKTDEERVTKEKERNIVRARRDLIHSLTLCEVSHFHKQRREDFRDMMRSYLEAQIKFHGEIVEKLKLAKAEFDKLTN